MILSEGYVKVPGKHYKARVQCVATRRLTTMEWLIVNCTEKFHQSRTTSGQTVKYVFEEVFQLTSSEILIKPCIESLMSEQVILLDVESNFDYKTLRFSQIKLTDKGRRMAQDGLFPGAARELPLDIYYNPLTEKINQFASGNEKTKDAIEFGVESDYSLDFPEEKIIAALHRGLVGRGRFVASKLRIENIDCEVTTDWENCIKLEVWTDTEGNISTKPEIKEDGVKSLITSLFFTKEITSSKMPIFVWLRETEPKKIIGSGLKMKESFLNVSRNGGCVGMQENIYSLYKRTTTAFKQKTIFLWGTKDFKIRKENESIFIEIPCEFSVSGCVVVNDKNESVSFGKNTYSYDGRQIIVPIAFEDRRIKVGKRTLFDWIENVIKDKADSEIYYLALYSLPELAKKRKIVSEVLSSRWADLEIDAILKDVRLIAQTCAILGQEMLRLDDMGTVLWEKLSPLENKTVLDLLSEIMRLDCITAGSDTQRYIMSRLLERAEVPKSYNELLPLLLSMGIRNHEDALMYDDEIGHLYTRELILDTLKVIMEGRFTRLPELFEMDAFFNNYSQAINELEFLISGLKLFDAVDTESIDNAIEKCPDVAMIQSYAAEIVSKNSELLTKEINVYTEMKAIDAKRAECFFENLDTIIKKVTSMMQEEVRQITAKRRIAAGDADKLTRNRMFIVDTCALMHHPDLLLYFADEEYVRIPTKVIEELGKIKDMRSNKYDPELARVASRIAADIEIKYLKLFNSENKMRLMIENADLDLLPADLDKRIPDNQILSVALKYSDWDVTIISDDGVFRLTTLAQNIKAITSKDFIAEHDIYKRSLERWVEKFEKAGGSLNKVATVLSKSESSSQIEKMQHDFEKNSVTDAVALLEQGEFDNPAIDMLSIRELKKYLSSDLTEPVCSMLQTNGIKTIGQFRQLTPQSAMGLKAKGKQTIYRNNVARAVKKFRELQVAADEKNDNAKKESSESADQEENKIFSTNAASYLNDLLDTIRANDSKAALSLLEKYASEHDMDDQVKLFCDLFTVGEESCYTKLMYFMLAVFQEKYVQKTLKAVDNATVEKIKKTADFQAITRSLVNSQKYTKLGLLMNQWNINVDFDSWFDRSEKAEILEQINSAESIEMYIEECLTGDEREELEYLRANPQFPLKVFKDRCLNAISKSSAIYEEYIQVLCEYYNDKHENQKNISLSLLDVVNFAIALPAIDENGLQKLIEQCSTTAYVLEINKHYAQQIPSDKVLEPLRNMIAAGLSAKRIVYVYMNTKLRSEVNVDLLITEMCEHDYTVEDVMRWLRDYWIIGKIKYVQEDGFVRIASGSISNSRLMVLNNNRIFINGEHGWQDPVEGMQIFFKLQDFIEGGLFYIHYPCTDIAYSN